MKKIVLIMALLVVAVSAVAQPKKLTEEDKENFLNAKAKMMQKDLELSDEQMEKFLPIYKTFQKDLMGIKRNHVVDDSLTMEVAYGDMMARLEYQEKVIKVQKNALKELKSVLDPFQLLHFLDAERTVQKDIMKHKKARHDRMKKNKMKFKSSNHKRDFREKRRDNK